MSLTFMVFLTVPILAPSLGALILLAAPWRYIFIVCGAFAAIVCAWAMARLPETLHPEYRLTLTRAHVAGAVRLVLGNRCSLFYTLAATVMFALCATTMCVAAFLNSRIVERLGMRKISHSALLIYIIITGLHSAVAALGI